MLEVSGTRQRSSSALRSTLSRFLARASTLRIGPKSMWGAAEDLLGEPREELSKSNIRQVAEKLWSAAALAVKAYAYWREGKRLSNHGEL